MSTTALSHDAVQLSALGAAIASSTSASPRDHVEGADEEKGFPAPEAQKHHILFEDMDNDVLHEVLADDQFDDDAPWKRDPNAPIVELTNLHKTYLLGVEGVPALRGVSVTIRRGEMVVILGKSGGGKTSMLNVIGTIDKPTKGDLVVCGQRITSKTTDAEFADLRLRRIGFVFQTFNLIASMTAQENVELPMILAGRLTAAQRIKRAQALLARVGMAPRMGHLPSQLSGGEQQRVTIARALANSPDLMLLDEPTGDLDTHNSHIILRLLLELNRRHRRTLVMVTHDQNLKNFAHRVIHMVDGKVFRVEKITQEQRDEAEAGLARDIAEFAARRAALPPVVAEVEVRDPMQMYAFHGLNAKR